MTQNSKIPFRSQSYRNARKKQVRRIWKMTMISEAAVILLAAALTAGVSTGLLSAISGLRKEPVKDIYVPPAEQQPASQWTPKPEAPEEIIEEPMEEEQQEEEMIPAEEETPVVTDPEPEEEPEVVAPQPEEPSTEETVPSEEEPVHTENHEHTEEDHADGTA